MSATSNMTRLAQMGVGKEIVNSCIERGNIKYAVTKSSEMLKYFKKAVKDGIYSKQHANDFLTRYHNELLSVEHLAHKYSELWLEKFCKVKLQMEKFINQ